MGSEFPRSPKFLKGALVAYESQYLGSIPNIIIFQYNPEKMGRSLAHRLPTGVDNDDGSSKSETYRVTGPPKETIDITVSIDATDQLEEPQDHPYALSSGINPALAALEMLMYPPSEQYLDNKLRVKKGSSKQSKSEVPVLLFVWGRNRVLPVRLRSFSINEQAFDQLLNPIRAEVTLGMEVMSIGDVKEDNISHGIYMAATVQKEVLARINILTNVEQIAGMLPI